MENCGIIKPLEVEHAYNRIKSYLHKTPILHSETLNEMLGVNIYFKAESLQKTGAFKVRGVLNHLLVLQEKKELPSKIVAYSTGNHGIGLAWVAKLLNLHARIYLPKDTSLIKQQAAIFYGAEIILTNSRKEAEQRSYQDLQNGFYYLHPSDSDTTIAGAGTMCYEALKQMNIMPDAIFAACGGGGLLAGSYLAKELISPKSILVGCEPEQANDAFLSLQQGDVFSFSNSPSTVADGLRALKLSQRTFAYIKKLDDFILADEWSIYYSTAWLIHLLKIACEPSSAINLACLMKWLKNNKQAKNVLLLLSGGNIDPSLYREIWKEDYLLQTPTI